MAITKMSIRLDTRLADEAVKLFGLRSRSEAVRYALQQIVDAHSAPKPHLKKPKRFIIAEQRD
jgi:metal-responsive CopG/Arc/MetJ family transcriptional regulator